MKRADLNRRDFNKLTMAAFGGMVAGAAIGCGGQNGDDGANGGNGADGEDGGNGADGSGTADNGEPGAAEVALSDAETEALLNEPHVCRGLNACQGKGRSEENSCAGTSACFTAEAHSCGGQNACKGQGGCGDKPGANACMQMGSCQVPLMDRDTWDTARSLLEQALKTQDKTLNMPPQMGPPSS